MHVNLFVITSIITLLPLFVFLCHSASFFRYYWLPSVHTLYSNCQLYMHKSFSFCISISIFTFASSLAILYSVIHITAHTLLLLCRHFMLWFLVLLCMLYRLFQLPDLNSASALSCCRCALTWFKFKLACMSLANQMFCMITYGWALSEIKGCCPFCLPVTGLSNPSSSYTYFGASTPCLELYVLVWIKMSYYVPLFVFVLFMLLL